MKTLVAYYSYTGHAKTLARAAESDTALAEIRDIKRPGMFKAYSAGCLAAMRGRAWAIAPMEIDWAAHDRVLLFSPIWAGHVPPTVNGFLQTLPQGKAVTVTLISDSGKSKCRAQLEAAIAARGCVMEGCEDVQA